MNDVVINVRTIKEIKENVNKVFLNMGINTSSAINLFLKQSIIKHKLPFEIDSSIDLNKNIKDTYPKGYFNLFGSGKNIDIEEPNDIDISVDGNIKL